MELLIAIFIIIILISYWSKRNNAEKQTHYTESQSVFQTFMANSSQHNNEKPEKTYHNTSQNSPSYSSNTSSRYDDGHDDYYDD